MEEVQTSTFDFAIPIILIYAAACGIYLFIENPIYLFLVKGQYI